MFLIFYLSALAAFELQRLVGRYAPSNVLARQIRAHGGIHAVIAAPIVAGANVVCAGLAVHLGGEPRPLWLNVLIVLFVWNGMKFIGLTLRSIVDVVLRGRGHAGTAGPGVQL
ncbi:MAG TPA: hypothetical protein VIR30_12485 [Nocardioides sp.]